MRKRELEIKFNEYCERVAKNKGLTMEEVKELKIVQSYKESLEEEVGEGVVIYG